MRRRLLVTDIGRSGDLYWWKSSKSCEGACVEVARALDGGIFVRDSKNRGGHVLHFDKTAWNAFLHDVREGAISPDRDGV
jgi:hypothetical protein